MIPHKSRKYRAILDISFVLRVNGYTLQLVNKTTEMCAPEEAISQIGTVLLRISEAMTYAPEKGDNMHLMKLDIKDGFWQLVCVESEEWNCFYVLPNALGQPIKIVLPLALQMGWSLSSPFFCTASETARASPRHTRLSMKHMSGVTGNTFLQLLEVYVDDFIQVVQSSDMTVL